MGKTGAGKYRSFFALQKKDRYFALRALRMQREVLSTPQSLRDGPLGGTGKGFPDTPSVASLRVRIPSCAYLQPPSHFVTAPWGARGRDSPIPLLSLRSDGALGALGAAFMGGMVGKKLQFAVFVGVYAAWDHAAVLGACVERGRDDEIGGAAVRGERNVVQGG